MCFRLHHSVTFHFKLLSITFNLDTTPELTCFHLVCDPPCLPFGPDCLFVQQITMSRDKRLAAQREELEAKKMEEIERKREERRELERHRSMRPVPDEDELKGACAVLASLAPGRLKVQPA